MLKVKWQRQNIKKIKCNQQSVKQGVVHKLFEPADRQRFKGFQVPLGFVFPICSRLSYFI